MDVNGFRVIDAKVSHMNDHPIDKTHLIRALYRTIKNNDDREFIENEVHMGEIIGYTDCVTTDKNDEIVYRKRPNRDGLTRFVIGREPEPTDMVTIVLKRVQDFKWSKPYYVIITAYYGPRILEPWDKRATMKDVKFWKNHALRIESLENN